MIELIQGIDFAFSFFVQSFSNIGFDWLFLLITFLGNPGFWFALAALLYWLGYEWDSFYLMNVILLSSLLTAFIKPIVGRLRPFEHGFRLVTNPLHSIASETYSFNIFSFPSGHSMMIASALGYFYKRLKEHHLILFTAIVFLVMLSRIYLGMHFLSDVLVGALIGIIIGKIVFDIKTKKIKENEKIDFENHKKSILLVIFGLACLYFLEHFEIFVILFGFYAGFFTLKLMKKENIGSIKKAIFGFIGFGLIGMGIISTTGIIELSLMFLAGIWVSLLNPLFFDLIFNKT